MEDANAKDLPGIDKIYRVNGPQHAKVYTDHGRCKMETGKMENETIINGICGFHREGIVNHAADKLSRLPSCNEGTSLI